MLNIDPAVDYHYNSYEVAQKDGWWVRVGKKESWFGHEINFELGCDENGEIAMCGDSDPC
jgi:hypothetical protein